MSHSNDLLHDIIKLLNSLVAKGNYAALNKPECLLPLNIALNSDDPFERGVAASVLHIYHLICQSPQGRQAILDLGFKPLFENLKSPTCRGLDD